MEQVQFSKGMRPSRVEVAGHECKLFFSMQAAMDLESYFGRPYLEVVLDMLQVPGDDGQPKLPMTVVDQAAIISILMAAAGQRVQDADLQQLHMQDFSCLARAAQAEMIAKMPESKKKQPPAYQKRGTGRR